MERRTIPPRFKKVGHIVGGGLGAASGVTAATLLAMSGQDPGIFMPLLAGILASTVVALPFWYGIPKLINAIHFRRRPTYPSRWKLPVPLPDDKAKPVRTLQGPVKPTKELLKAPLSGVECLGYEVSVLFDVSGDKRPPMWVLEEERTAAFEINGETVEANRSTLMLKTRAVKINESVPGAEQKVARFLRQRGLFASEGNYSLFEAHILPDTQYRVDFYDEPEGAAATVKKA